MSRRGSSSLGQIGYWVAAIAIVSMGWTLHVVIERQDESMRTVARTFQVLESISETGEAISRAEAAQRGFLLSATEDFAIQRAQALASATRFIERVKALTADNALQQERSARLSELIVQRRAMMEQNANRRREEGLATVTVTVAGGAGRALSAQIAALTDEMKREEARLLEDRRADERRDREMVNSILLWALAVLLLALIPGYIGFLREARSRSRAENQLVDLTETLPGAVVQYRLWPDGRSRYEFLSAGVETMRGVERAAAFADPQVILGTILEDDRQPFLDALEKGARTLTPVEHDYRIRGPDGTIRWFRTTAAPRPRPDGSVVFSAFWADVTERRAMDAALREAKEEAEAATRAKSTFLATMSHEIRTPMNGVLGMLELLSLTRLDREQRTTLEVIRQSGRSLLRIIDDILDFSKVEAGKLDIHPEPASIPDLVRRSCDMYRGSASSKGLRVERSIDERISTALLVDPVRLQQILGNFLSNAIKFTNRGGIKVQVDLLSRAEGAERVRFTVEDTGVGVSPEDQEHLFAPFAQVGASLGARGGTGLGLAISRRLADMMGGTIEMHSEPGVGTRMALTLTLRIADPVTLRAPQARDAVNVGPCANGCRDSPSPDEAAREGTLVLVVDDHPINRMVLQRQVNALGYAAEVADNGVEALRQWESGRFTLMLSDCNMPEMDGYELARRVRLAEARGGRRRTTIIACTANALGGEVDKCFEAGMDDYLAKPVDLARLGEKLGRWLPLPAHPDDVVLDPSVLAEVSAGDSSLEREIILRFYGENVADVRTLERAFRANELEELTRCAHRMKGAARTVGAKRLAAACESLERAGRSNDRAGIEASLGGLNEELARLDTHVQHLRAAGA